MNVRAEPLDSGITTSGNGRMEEFIPLPRETGPREKTKTENTGMAVLPTGRLILTGAHGIRPGHIRNRRSPRGKI